MDLEALWREYRRHSGTIGALRAFEKAVAEIERLEAALQASQEVLRKLANEASGFWAMASPDVHGATNLSVLRRRIDEAFAALALTADAPSGRPEGERKK